MLRQETRILSADQAKLNPIQKFDTRIEFLELEVRQLRLLQEQQITDQNSAMRTAVTKPQVSEIFLKGAFEMLDHTFGGIDRKINLDL